MVLISPFPTLPFTQQVTMTWLDEINAVIIHYVSLEMISVESPFHFNIILIMEESADSIHLRRSSDSKFDSQIKSNGFGSVI